VIVTGHSGPVLPERSGHMRLTEPYDQYHDHAQQLRTPISTIATDLQELLSRRVVAYIVGIKERSGYQRDPTPPKARIRRNMWIRDPSTSFTCVQESITVAISRARDDGGS